MLSRADADSNKNSEEGKVQEMMGDAHTTLVHDFQCSKTDSLQFNYYKLFNYKL